MNKNFIFQTKFSKNAEKVITKEYNLSADDKILMAVWAGKAYSVTLRKRGFLFTKNGFYWNFPAVEENGNEGETVERSQCNCNFLNKETTDFKLAFAKTDGISNELHLKTGLTEYNFLFPSDFPKEQISELEKIIRDYFTGYFNEENYVEKSKMTSILLGMYAIPDFFRCFGANTSVEWNKFKEKIKDFFKRDEKQKSDSASKCATRIQGRFPQFLFLLFDLIADLLFSSCIISLVKNGYPSSLKDITQDIIYRIVLFLLLKVIVILAKKNTQKTISCLLLLMLAVSTWLFIFEVHRFFAGYVILAGLCLITIQFSLGFSKNTIKTKAWLFLFLGISLYILVPIVSDKTLLGQIQDITKEIVKNLKLGIPLW